MKKFALILLSVALVLSCTVIAFADPVQYTITVDPAKAGETYTAYKIFDVRYDEPDQSTNLPSVYTYTISDTSEWWSVLTTASDPTNQPSLTTSPFVVDGLKFTRTALPGTGTTYIVEKDPNSSLSDSEFAAQLAEKLYANVANKTVADTDVATTGNSPTATLDVGSDGYYFVTTTLGSLCILNTTTPTVTVSEKNTVPTVDKKISNDGNTYTDSTISSSIGAPIYFEITVTDGDNTDQALTLVDTMTPGLDFSDYNEGQPVDFAVYLPDSANPTTPVPATSGNTTNYTLTINDSAPAGFTIVFSEAFMRDNVESGDRIVIKYTGILTSDAYIKGNTLGENGTEATNTNTVEMTYSAQTDDDSVSVETYMFDIIKTKSDPTILDGAQFDLYDAATGGNQIKVRYDSTDATTGIKTYYVDPDVATSDPIEAGKARIIGIGATSTNYYLEEIVAPDGYNELDARQAFPQGSANNTATLAENYTTYVSGGVRVINNAGSVMPSTGGIGTYLFYGVGAILVVGAVVVLVSKKRMHAYSD